MAISGANPTARSRGDISEGDRTLHRAMDDALKESRLAKVRRNQLSRMNLDAYMGIQDWTHKQDGQSTEFLPKVPMAVETMSAFIKRGLTKFGDFFRIEFPQGSTSPLPEESIHKLIMCYLNRLYVGNNKYRAFPTVMSDGTKAALLESLYIFKVHGTIVGDLRPFDQGGQLTTIEFKNWRLRVDLVQRENYFPDPTGRHLYEIHRTERDLHEVLQDAEAGIYQIEDVAGLKESVKLRYDERRRAAHKGQNETELGGPRNTVVIDEYWGTIVDTTGRVLHKNVFFARANDKFIIRQPTPNPFWHGESPFVVEPIIRVPFSVWHKALYDHASPLNLALNELFNLMVDGGISAVWGIKQLRSSHLTDPNQISGGIPQGATLDVKDSLPPNEKVLETIAEGNVPQDAIAIFEMVSREFNNASLTNEVALGTLPQREVKATEIIESGQSRAITLDSIIGDIENPVIGNVIRKAWLTILQNADDLDGAEVVNAIGPKAALALARMSPSARYATFAPLCSFKVFGLSSILEKAKEFQKVMAVMQVTGTNPIMLQAFMQRFSGSKIQIKYSKSLTLTPRCLRMTRMNASI